MHIIVLGLRGIPGIQGGVETHAENLYPILATMGCHIEVLARSPYVPKNLAVWKGVVIKRIWAPKWHGAEVLVHSVLGVLYAAIKRPDVLHIHAVGPAIVTPLARLFGISVVVTHHGPDYEREKWGRGARAILKIGERVGMRYSSKRIVISEGIYNLVKENYGRESTIIHNGVILHETPSTDETLKTLDLIPYKYILNVSRYVPEKRHIDLINAFNQAGLNDWRLVLVGKIEPDDQYCEKVLSIARKHPNVVIAGFRSGEALNELYAKSGIFVLPSSHEGLPIALLEALSFGVRVLASDISPNKEIGLAPDQYFPLGNVGALARLLKYYSEHEMNYFDKNMQREEINKKYNWNLISEQTLAIYRSLVN